MRPRWRHAERGAVLRQLRYVPVIRPLPKIPEALCAHGFPGDDDVVLVGRYGKPLAPTARFEALAAQRSARRELARSLHGRLTERPGQQEGPRTRWRGRSGELLEATITSFLLCVRQGWLL
jgi:hypothetical protein